MWLELRELKWIDSSSRQPIRHSMPRPTLATQAVSAKLARGITQPARRPQMECSRHTEGDSAVRLMPALRVVAAGQGFRVVLRVRRRRAYRTGGAAGQPLTFEAVRREVRAPGGGTPPSKKDGPLIR